jgi:hypothetical protein
MSEKPGFEEARFRFVDRKAGMRQKARSGDCNLQSPGPIGLKPGAGPADSGDVHSKGA